MGFGLLELAIVLFVIFLILGPKRIQGLLRALGRGVRDFKLEFDKDGGDRKENRQLPGEERSDEHS